MSLKTLGLLEVRKVQCKIKLLHSFDIQNADITLQWYVAVEERHIPFVKH